LKPGLAFRPVAIELAHIISDLFQREEQLVGGLIEFNIA